MKSVWLVYKDEYDGEHSYVSNISAYGSEAAANAARDELAALLSRNSWTRYEVEEIEFEPA